jgi:integrase/recombinase XerD
MSRNAEFKQTKRPERGPNAEYAYADFFKARISNANTRKAYKHAVDRFLHWCKANNVVFRQITSFLIGDYLEHHLLDQDGHPLAAPSKKQHLAALRHFFANQQLYHGIGLNPAVSASPNAKLARRGPKRFLPSKRRRPAVRCGGGQGVRPHP